MLYLKVLQLIQLFIHCFLTNIVNILSKRVFRHSYWCAEDLHSSGVFRTIAQLVADRLGQHVGVIFKCESTSGAQRRSQDADQCQFIAVQFTLSLHSPYLQNGAGNIFPHTQTDITSNNHAVIGR
jgi:hypothetical protein